MDKPLVSVIMGVYNQKDEEILRQAVNSILNQSYSNFEFIIWDDGSSKEEAKVVQALEKLDEITAVGPTAVCEFSHGEYKTYDIAPEDFGFNRCKKEALKGGTPEENAQMTRDILSGKEKGPKRDTVLMNAGAALYIADKSYSIAKGVEMAKELIDKGAAMEALEKFIKESNR